MRLRRWLLRPVAIAVSSCFTQGWCNPTGPHIVNGAVTFQRPDARTLNVTNSPGAIINWRGFSIGANEVTRFVQQSASSAVLNRVVGADVSRIYGQLLSNGRVFLVNPAGIMIGPGAVIDTASLVASTLNLTDADFLAGKLRFRGDENSGPIVNQGSIRTSVGGHAILVAPNVENAGLIEAPGGSILLAAGQKLTIGSIDLPGVQFEIQAPSDSVVNVGKLIADGGAVGAFAGTLRHSGDIRANALTRDEAGRVVLEGQSSVMVAGGSTTIANGGTGGNISIESGDTTLVSGEVTAAGTAGRGGTVQILGDRVGILGRAGVSASGKRAGGTILIGGDVHGENPRVRNASGTFVGSDATVTADAVTRGDGGRIVVWANEATRVHGRLSARGADGGKGGFVETSGRYLEVTRAPQIGAGGTWLLDPRDIEVIAGESTNIGEPPTFLPIDDNSKLGAAQINAQLDEGVNVVIDTGAAGSQQGDLTINAPIVQVSGISSNASLTLNAANSVTVNADIVLAGGDINVTTGSATGAMTVNSATVRTDGAMHLDLAGALVVQTANASDARLHASAGQAISARSVVVTTSGSGSASISNGAGGQTIAVNNANAGSGIDVVSTGSGVARISNGLSDDGLPIARPGPQSITIDDGDRLQVIGRGGTAMIESAADQFIALRGTGANQIVLGAANAAGSALIQASGSQFVSAGSRGQRGGVTLVGGVAEGTSASIRTIGPLGSQNVSTSGTISAVGGSAIGSEGPSASADAGIRHEGAGPQVISAESIVLRGGTGGGTDNDGFIASIEGAQF
ncbi:MAG: two-partner secretion domain-containing protein, partial [Burkholderiales bacterium]